MTRLTWGELAKRNYEFGVDRGVFYPKNGIGYSWPGLVSVKETTVDASQSLIYIDGVGHQNQLKIGSFAAAIEAVTYPDAFEPFDGTSHFRSAQTRRVFDFCYRTMQAGGHYKIHLVYNALATPTERNNASINSSMDIQMFTWDLSTRPEVVPDAKASSHFIIDTTQVNPGVVAVIENRLYGNDASAADMPTVPELLAIFDEFALFRVVDHGDGTVTVTGPPGSVEEIDAAENLWKLEWPSVIQLDEYTYSATSL